MRIFKDDSGQVLVLAAFSMVLLMGFVGFATDVGALFHDQRDEQTAVDAAAIAAAVNYKFNASISKAQAAAQTAAQRNGVANVSDLTVNVPPQNGPNQSAGYIETILTEPHNTIFMSLFGLRTVNVTTRAVATINGAPAQGCIYVLNPTASAAMDLQGSFNVDAPGCGVEINSNSASALQFTGAAGTLTAGWVAVNGGESSHSTDSTPAPTTYTNTPISNPWGNITGPGPTYGGCGGSTGTYSWVLNGVSGTTTGSTDTSTTTLTGNYAGPGDNTAICFTQPVTLSNVVLGPGIYVFENGVTLQNSVTGIGVTLDVYSGSLTIPTGGVSFGSATATTPAQAATDGLVAPTDGPTNGIAIMEPPSNSSEIQIQKGNATGNITGAIYAPNPDAQLYLQDSGGDKSGGISIWGDIVVGTLYDKTATMTIHSYSDVFSSNPNKVVTLVE
jgi:hypothetical protein